MKEAAFVNTLHQLWPKKRGSIPVLFAVILLRDHGVHILMSKHLEDQW